MTSARKASRADEAGEWTLGDVVVEMTTRMRVMRVEPNEPSESIETFNVRILIERDEVGARIEVGEVVCSLLHPEVVEARGGDLAEVCDAASEEYAHIHDTFFRDGDFRTSISDALDVVPGSSLLLVDSVKVSPAFRGRRVGLAAVARIIDVFAMRSALVVCRPYPMQFSSAERRRNLKLVETGLDDQGRDQGRARRALQKYWGRLGFNRVGRSPYYAMSPHAERPWHAEGFFGKSA